MARMLPPVISSGTKSSAERKLYEKMKSEMPDEWMVIHSLGLAKHGKKPWAEIDFVLVGPPGVFCLEVKGGRVERNNGVWVFTNRRGERAHKTEGPFEQVGTASSALYNHLRDAGKRPFRGLVGYGVCFPDIVFPVPGPEFEQEVIYDARDGGNPFSQYVTRLAHYWSEWIFSNHGRRVDSLSPHDIEAALQLLRGDFNLTPSLRSIVEAARIELVRLTEEQERTLQMFQENARVLVKGGAGSGKTLLAMSEAERLAGEGQSVLVCCFNRHLASYLKRATSNDGVRVTHLHGLMNDVIDRAVLRNQLPEAEEQDIFEVFFPSLCLEGLDLLGERGRFDVLIVDEAQDILRDTYLEVLDAVLKDGLAAGRWRIFLDPNQNVFHGTGIGPMRSIQQYAPAQVQLNRNCRNTAPIVVFTQLLSGVYALETAEVEGPEVQKYWYQGDTALRTQVSNCVTRLLSGGLKPEQIVVLSPRRFENSGLRDGLRNVPSNLTQIGNDGIPAKGTIGFSSIGAFKGLEADAVVLVDLETVPIAEMSMLSYVGASRARSLLAVFLHEQLRPEYMKRAHEFGEHHIDIAGRQE